MAQQYAWRPPPGPPLTLDFQPRRETLHPPGTPGKLGRAESLAPLGVVAGTLLPYLPHFVFGTLPFEDDLVNYFWPLMHHVAAGLAAGSLPLWTSGIYSGFPLLADSEAGTFFPLNWLLVAFDDPRGLLLILCAGLCAGALGLYAFARSLGAGRFGAAIGAWCWSLGGFATGHLVHVSILNSTAPLPWLLLALDRVLATKGIVRRRWRAAAAALHALQWLGGHVQPALMTWWLAGAYIVFRLYVCPHPGSPPRTRTQKLGLLLCIPAVVGAGAFALSAAQLLPTIELAAASARGVGAAYAYGATYSLTPFDLITLFSPLFFLHESGARWSLWAGWETSAYTGILPLLLAAVALAPGGGRRTTREAPGSHTAESGERAARDGDDGGSHASHGDERLDQMALFFGGVALASIWLALGDSAPLAPYRWVQALPLMNVLRAPARFLMLFDLSVAVLAALGAQRLLSITASWSRKAIRRAAVGFTAATLAIFCLVFAAAGWIGSNRPATLQWLDAVYGAFPNGGLPYPSERLFDFLQWAVWLGNPSLAFALLVLPGSMLWLLALSGGRLPPRDLRLYGLVLVLADLSFFAFAFRPPIALQSFAQPETLVTLLRDSADNTRVFSWPQSATQPDRLLRWDVAEASGYSSLELRRQSELAATVIAYDNRLLDMLNVGFIVLPPRAMAIAPGSPPVAPELDPLSPMLYIAANSPAPQRTFLIRPAAPVNRLRIVSALEHAPQLTQGQAVARLTVVDTGGHRSELPIRAGIETAEWALDRPDVRSVARHTAAPIALSFEAHDDFSPSYMRHLYVADIPLAAGNETAALANVQASVELPGVNWLVYRIELLTANGAPAVQPGARSLDRFGVSSFEPIVDSSTARVYRNTTALPRARLVPNARIEPDRGRLLNQLSAPDFDPEQTVLLENVLSGPVAVTEVESTGPVNGSVALNQVGETVVEVRAETQREAWLVLADTWYDGWKAYDNGQPVTLYRANGTQMAVRLAAGSHRFRFVFEPAPVYAGIAISLFSMAAAGLVCLAARPATGGPAASGPCA